MTDYTPEYIAARNAAMAKETGWIGYDALDPTVPSGHAYGLGVSTRLTSYYRQTHRKQAVDVTPQEVIDCLVQAGVKNWVLMGLHGYVGYLPMPRATQDVDVMIPYSQKKKSVEAIAERWPMLEKIELSQVVRFMDPGDPDGSGQPKPVIDIMLPWSKFQETILKDHVVIDAETGNRIPTVEAAIVAKYAALVSPHRDWDKKQQDAVDMRRIMKANAAAIDRLSLETLANQVWEQGGREILEFLSLALDNKPFPI
jgi:hypothetical protein